MVRTDAKCVRTNRADGSFLSFRETRRAAREAGKPIGDYLESIWNCVGQADRVVQRMQQLGCLSRCENVLEIGPGSGRFLQAVRHCANPNHYEIYETALEWARWLSKTNSPYVVQQPADGHSLSATTDRSCDLVHGHGVFVYLPPLISFEYFKEMARVCRLEGHIIFDFFPSEEFDEASVLRWLSTNDRFATVLPRSAVTRFFERRGFTVVGEFYRRVSEGRGLYLAFRRQKDMRRKRLGRLSELA